MKLGLEMPVLPGLFSLTRVHNTGVAFGVGQGNNTVTGLVACGVLVLAAWIAQSWDWQKRWIQGVAGLIAGGAIGNLIDRARLGYVLDFLDFHTGSGVGQRSMWRMRRLVWGSVWWCWRG